MFRGHGNKARPKPKPEVDREMEGIRLKTREKSDMWLDFYTQVVPILLGDEADTELNTARLRDKLVVASELADKGLELFEERWGRVTDGAT